MSKRQILRIEALLDGITGTVGVPAISKVSYRVPSKYRRGQSDVERSWTFVGKYLEAVMQDYEAMAEDNSPSEKTKKYA